MTKLARTITTAVATIVCAACVEGARRPATSPQDHPAAVAPEDHSGHVGATASPSETTPAATAPTVAEAAAESAPHGWFCPMHPDVTSSQPGRCGKCDMLLVAGNPFETQEYLLDFSTSPAAVRPGVPFEMRLRVRHPGTGKIVNAFEEVHEKQYHLFVVSHDMSVFQHIHPALDADGSWRIDVVVPKAGYYRVLSDFLPAGGSPQFLGHTFVTAGFDGDLASEAAVLTPDTVLRKTVDTTSASVTFEPGTLLAGEHGHLDFTLTDSTTGEPVMDLQPYLGAFGHTLILSEDMVDVVHAHPAPGSDDLARGIGGPRVRFEGYLPRPGMYRAWTQFVRGGHLSTFTFTFRVWSTDEAFRARR